MKMNWDWKQWAIAAGIRAVKTFFQCFAGFLTVGALWHEISWVQALSASGVAFVYSIVTSLAGLPEVQQKPQEGDE